MSGSSYKHKSGATKRREKEKTEQDTTKLQKLDTVFARPNIPNPEQDKSLLAVASRDSSPLAAGSPIYRYNPNSLVDLRFCPLRMSEPRK